MDFTYRERALIYAAISLMQELMPNDPCHDEAMAIRRKLLESKQEVTLLHPDGSEETVPIGH